jgi:hypothetical protein
MGKQNHAFPMTGRVDTLTFFQTKDGTHMVRKRKNAGKRTFKSPDVYEKAQANMAEFARGAAAAKLLRFALREPLRNLSTKPLIAALTKEVVRALKADSINPQGLRNLNGSNLQELKGYEINGKSELQKVFSRPFNTSIDRVGGILNLEVTSIIPRSKEMAYPLGATHFKVLAAGMELDFDGKKQVTDIKRTNLLPIDKNPLAPVLLECQVTANSTHPLILVGGIEFYCQVNGDVLPLENGAFSSIKILEVLEP